jgi:hypothetical protein
VYELCTRLWAGVGHQTFGQILDDQLLTSPKPFVGAALVNKLVPVIKIRSLSELFIRSYPVPSISIFISKLSVI